MVNTRDKLTAAAAPGVLAAKLRGREAARQVGGVVNTRVMPYAQMARQRATDRLRDDIAPELTRRVRRDVAPKVAAAVGTAMVASAPVRGEALRRGRAVLSAVRGEAGTASKKKRRWPIAFAFFGVGALAGAAAAWARSSRLGAGDPYPTADPWTSATSATSATSGSNADDSHEGPDGPNGSDDVA